MPTGVNCNGVFQELARQPIACKLHVGAIRLELDLAIGNRDLTAESAERRIVNAVDKHMAHKLPLDIRRRPYGVKNEILIPKRLLVSQIKNALESKVSE